MSAKHEVLINKTEEKLRKMSYKIYSYNDLPTEVKRKLSGDPDVKAERNGEWLFVEICVTGHPHVEKYLRAGKTILVLPIENTRNLKVWGKKDLES